MTPDIEERLELDYQLGEDIKEKLIPRAIDWFTGEALQFEELGDDMEGDEFEDDEDEDEDEDEDDEDAKSGDAEDDSEEEVFHPLLSFPAIFPVMLISLGRYFEAQEGSCRMQAELSEADWMSLRVVSLSRARGDATCVVCT